MRTTDLVASVVVMVGAVLLLAWIIPTDTAPAQSPLDIPPARVPAIAVWTCLVMGAALGVQSLRARPDETPADIEAAGAATGIGVRELAHLALLSALVVAIALAMPLVGFEVTAGVLLVAMMIFLRQRNVFVLLAVALVVPIGLSQLAWHVFTVEFP